MTEKYIFKKYIKISICYEFNSCLGIKYAGYRLKWY
jgi:hypothetical protein